MTKLLHLFATLSFVLACGIASAAQTNQQESTPPSGTPAELSILIGQRQIKFAPLRQAQELRLEVFNNAGALLYDSGSVTATELNWNLHDSQGQPLAPGLYAYTLSLKVTEAEAPRKHQGHFIIEKGNDQIWLTTKGVGSLGAEVTGGELTIAGHSEGATAGTGYLASGRTLGERAGIQRDTQGRSLADDKAVGSEKDLRLTPSISGSGITNRITKWGDGPNGVVSDSTIHETAGGDLGVGTSAPGGVFDLQRANAGDILQRFWNTGTGGAKLRYVTDTGQTAQVQLTDLTEWLSAIAGNNTIGLQFRVRGTGTPNTEAQLNASARMTILRNGNVGIGTTSPDIRLEVVGTSSTGTIYTTTFGSDNALIGRSAGGTANAPAATPAGQSLMLLGGRGHNGTGFTLNKATVDLEASEDWTNVATGARIIFNTTGNGSSTSQERVRIDHNGNVGIGTTTPGSRLEVAGAIGADFQYNLNGNRILHNTGTTNLFVGVNAGLGITTGFSNAFFGYEAGRLTSTGDRNSFFGRSAGESNTDGNENSFFGHSAGLANVTGNYNAFFGYLAGTANMGGHSNAFFGRSAGAANTEGTFNTFVGIFAGQANTVNGANTFVGSSAGLNSTGQFNSFFGTNAGTTNTAGDRNTVIGSSANVASGNLSYATAIGAGAVVSTSNTVVLGRDLDQISIPGSAFVGNGIETTSLATGGDTLLGDNGTVRVGNFFDGFSNDGHVCRVGQFLATCSSTRRVKNQIRSFHTGLALLQRLRPVTFNWKGNSQPDMGLIAEEVAEVEPRLVTHDHKTGEINGVKYDHLSAVFINAFKEQQAQIAAQQRQIASLKKLVCRTRPRAALCR